MSNKVWVVLNSELGWDCLVGVFSQDKFSEEEINRVFPADDSYVVYDKIVETDLGSYD